MPIPLAIITLSGAALTLYTPSPSSNLSWFTTTPFSSPSRSFQALLE